MKNLSVSAAAEEETPDAEEETPDAAAETPAAEAPVAEDGEGTDYEEDSEEEN